MEIIKFLDNLKWDSFCLFKSINRDFKGKKKLADYQ